MLVINYIFFIYKRLYLPSGVGFVLFHPISSICWFVLQHKFFFSLVFIFLLGYKVVLVA